MLKMFSQSFATVALCALTTSAYCTPQWYVTAGAGAELPGVRANTTINNNSLANPPYNLDIYSSKDNVNAALLLEAGKHWDFSGSRIKSLALGLQYQYFLPTNVGRQVMQYSSPAFLNYRYRLDLEANILLLNGKIELFSWRELSPFINVGVGAVQLIASNYKEYAYSGITARTSPAFQDGVNYQFTYQVGAGVDLKLTQTLIGSINYLYHPLAQFTTRNGQGSWAGGKLNFGNVGAQTVFVAFTYMI